MFLRSQQVLRWLSSCAVASAHCAVAFALCAHSSARGAGAPFRLAAPSAGYFQPHAGEAQRSPEREALAPDGRRGLGALTPLNDLLSLLRSNAEPDRAFKLELDTLVSDLKLQLDQVRTAYEQAQLFELLAPGDPRTLDALHARFGELAEDPLPTLAAGGKRAAALAQLLLDARMQVRARALGDAELELVELENGLRALRAATDGFATFTQVEASNIAARVDLAASWLRALRNDLAALRVPFDARAHSEQVALLLTFAAASEGEGVRRANVERLCEPQRKLAELMGASLFTTRLAPSVESLVQWRAELLRAAAPLVERAERALPEADRNAPPDATLTALSKSERVRRSGQLAFEALQHDPLDERAVWLMAHASEFHYGLLQSRPWYDRYLALRRIRSHDHRSYQGRKLDARENEALEAVQRQILPDPQRPRGL
jgi:hypothetical protein